MFYYCSYVHKMALLIKRVISNYLWESVKHNKKAHKAKNVTCLVKCYANGVPKGGDVCLITQLYKVAIRQTKRVNDNCIRASLLLRDAFSLLNK